MIELYLAVRDSIGISSRVIINSVPTLIRDLPAGLYDLSHRNVQIGRQWCPNKIPSGLLEYCTKIEAEGFEFKGDTIHERVTNLGIVAQLVNK
jgi:hypothetical protein